MNLLTDTRLELMRRRLAGSGAGAAPVVATAVPRTPAGQLGIAERRMWKIYDLDPDSVSHNIGLVLDFDGYELDAVVGSFELMVREAEVLGSVIVVEDGVPRRTPVIGQGHWAVPGAVWEWGSRPANLPAADPGGHRADILAAASALVKAPFDLTREPPLRGRVYAGAGSRVTVVLVVHHLAVDDTSWALLLGTLVSGSRPGSGATARPGTDTAPDRATVDSAVRHALATWAAEDVRYPLSGSLPETDAAQSWLSPLSDRDGVKITGPVDPADIEALGAVSREVGATSNALLIAVCALSVYALTDAADHVLLVPSDNRRPGEDPSRVGYCGNIVPMRFSFDAGASVRDSLRTAVAAVYRAMEFATVDYGTVLTALRAAGGRFPVAEIMASVRNAPLRGVPVSARKEVSCESVFNGIGNYPITFAFEIAPDNRVHLEVDYQPDIVDNAFARRASAVTTALVARVPQALDRTVGDLVHAVRETETA
ncbi:peptide synthetase [Nocardia sp. NPDC024068]|uniref:peptide synthetase n=1 Tax=Nocardia sp. NPDC024068 TaxID=3157197 RepID=UPI0033D9F070